MLRMVVCVKQVPDTTEVRIDPETNTLIREGVPSILNPFDAHATEAAVQLKEKYGGHVTVLSMGPPQAAEALKKCISFGVDRAILVSDRAFAGADTLATSYTVAAGLRKIAGEEGLDLVLCGKQAIDGDTAQVGPGIACRLDLPQITYAVGVDEVDLEEGTITVQRRLEKGVQTVQAPLPALLTCVEEMNELRYASLPNMIKAARYEVEVWTAADLDTEPERLGLKGSATVVERIFAPPEHERGEIIPGGSEDPAGAAAALLDKLIEQAATSEE